METSEAATANSALRCLAAGNIPAPLPPSVEEAYRRKCIDLRRRITEIEGSNDTFRLRKVRLNRAIRRMRLERAYLLENLAKRMKKNANGPNGISAMYDEDSEGSSDGPPTPLEKPLRSKRSHRRPVPSPPPMNETNTSQNSFMQHETPKFQAYQPNAKGSRRTSSQSPSIDGHQVDQKRPSSSSAGNALAAGESSLQGASSPTHPPTTSTSKSLTKHPMVPSIPPKNAFAMYLESRFLSQPHKHPSATSENALIQLAQDSWKKESEPTRQLYQAQEAQNREKYEKDVKASREYEEKSHTKSLNKRRSGGDTKRSSGGGGGGGTSGRGGNTRKERAKEKAAKEKTRIKEEEDGEDEDDEMYDEMMDDADPVDVEDESQDDRKGGGSSGAGAGSGSGFTSVNA